MLTIIIYIIITFIKKNKIIFKTYKCNFVLNIDYIVSFRIIFKIY